MSDVMQVDLASLDALSARLCDIAESVDAPAATSPRACASEIVTRVLDAFDGARLAAIERSAEDLRTSAEAIRAIASEMRRDDAAAAARYRTMSSL